MDKKPKLPADWGPYSRAMMFHLAQQLFQVHERDILGGARFRFVLNARFAIVKALHIRGWGYTEIGRLLDRDHSTIINACRKAEKLMDKDPSYARKVKQIARMNALKDKTV